MKRYTTKAKVDKCSRQYSCFRGGGMAFHTIIVVYTFDIFIIT